MAKRHVIHLPGVEHKAPIPTAVKVGNMVYSSAIFGLDARTGERPDSVYDEVKNIFKYMGEIMELAGGSTEDIAKLSVLLKEEKYKEVVNEEWLKMFPDKDNRPARHSTVENLRGNLRVQIIMTAIL